MTPEDIADSVEYTIALPRRLNVSEMAERPDRSLLI